MWRGAVKARADLVTITSYNEWHEGTQIEPARPGRRGYQCYDGAWGLRGHAAETAYLDRTAYWVRRFTRLTTTSAAQLETSASNTSPSSTPRRDSCPRSISISGHDSIPSERPPSSAPKQSKPVRGEDAARPGLAAGDALELAQLLERVDADVRVGADAERDPAVLDAGGREEAVGEVGLGRRAGADRRAALLEQIQLGAVGVCGVHDGDVRPEATGAIEQLDRPAAVLCEALLDLARLLVGVNVQRQLLGERVAPELLEPVARAGADGVGGEADADPGGAERLELAQVVGRRLLAHARSARRVRRRRAGARARSRPRRPPRPLRGPRGDRGSGTPRRRCSRRPASRDRSRRRGCGRSQASAAPPRRASAPATPRSRRRPHGRAVRAETYGCAR